MQISALVAQLWMQINTETSLQILAYNIKRAINLVGTRKIMAAIDP